MIHDTDYPCIRQIIQRSIAQEEHEQSISQRILMEVSLIFIVATASEPNLAVHASQFGKTVLNESIRRLMR